MRSPTSPPPTAAAAATTRRKGNSGRSWLAISSTQIQHLQDVKKHTIMRRTGLPARDLRILDPMLNYPSTILGREKAIVINLEHIKAVITGTEVLVPNSISPLVEPFVAELQARVSVREQAETFGPMGRGALGTKVNSNVEMPEGNLGHFDVGKNEQAKLIPFEFKALEVCLESACKCLESETLTLEKEAYPALDELTSKISTLNLERVRQIKSRLVALSGRVQKVRDEIEHLLDDDMDMAEMYLTEKLTSSRVDESSFREDVNNDDSDLDDERDEDFKDESGSSHRGSYIGFKPNIEELEMLLEAYFVQIDGILNKLSTLREYVDDTEDYINIMLDEKQNQLLQMGVMLSTLTLFLTGGLVVVGIFGMNITIDLYSAPYSDFWKTTFGTLGGCIVLYILAIGWGKKSGLLQ